MKRPKICIEIEEDACLDFEVKKQRRNLSCLMYIQIQLGRKEHKLFLDRKGNLRHEEIK